MALYRSTATTPVLMPTFPGATMLLIAPFERDMPADHHQVRSWLAHGWIELVEPATDAPVEVGDAR
ncbi:MAG: hypothetical protein EAZ99_04000 [Alphaproteobacteria bacterium]|nr:MAG: hypothetical protein EAZ99_04000 [Alphaproteobacteria bacterium]